MTTRLRTVVVTPRAPDEYSGGGGDDNGVPKFPDPKLRYLVGTLNIVTVERISRPFSLDARSSHAPFGYR